MSLGGENVRDSMTSRERDLLDEAWIWRAIQQHAYRNGTVVVRIDPKYETPFITTANRIYRFPTDRQQFLDDARHSE